MPTALVIGATRGLGRSLALDYLSKGWTVLGTSRSDSPPTWEKSSDVKWVTQIDVSKSDVGKKLASGVSQYGSLDVTIINAGYFGFETFDSLDWDKQVTMYVTSAVAPPFIVRELLDAGALKKGGKIILIGSESGVSPCHTEKLHLYV
jgi:short-subunit dehydrogenase